MNLSNRDKDNIQHRKAESQKDIGYSLEEMSLTDFTSDHSLFNYSSQLNSPTPVQKKQVESSSEEKEVCPEEKSGKEKSNVITSVQGTPPSPPVQRKDKNIVTSASMGKESSGNKMPETVQAQMESSLGADFSDVHIHANDASAPEMNALAYTQGNDIHFAPGQYNPFSSQGQELLGHELTHVVQQQKGIVKPTTSENGKNVNDDPALEAEADSMGRKAASHQAVSQHSGGTDAASGSRPVVQTKCANCEAEEGLMKKAPSQPSIAKKSDSVCPNCKQNEGGIQLKRAGGTIQKEENTGILDGAVVELLNNILPIGNGFFFEITGGITWGYPVYTGGSALVSVDRISKEKLKVTVRKQGKIAFDTGVGGSLMIGKQKSNGNPNSKGVGVGIDAGANAMAGGMGTVLEEYQIPVEKVLSVVGREALDSILSAGPLLTAPVRNLLEQHSEQFLIRRKVEAGLFAQADAEAGAGIRRPGDNFNDAGDSSSNGGSTKMKGATWGPDDDRKPQGSAPNLADKDPLALLSFLRLAIGGHVGTSAIGGMDQSKSGDKTITSVFLEGKVEAMLNLPIPVVSTYLASIPPEVGVGVDLQFTQSPSDPTEVRVSVYTKQGEDQYYAGSANQQTMIFNLTKIMSVDEMFEAMKTGTIPPSASKASLTNVLEKVTFFNRLTLGTSVGPGFGTLLRRQQGVRSLLSDTTISKAKRVYGASLDTYLDFGAELDGIKFMSIAKRLIDTGKGAINSVSDAQTWGEGYDKLSKYLSGYASSKEFDALLNDVLDQTAVTTGKLRLQVGAGVGVAGRLSAGAKVRGDVSVEGGLSCELDVIGSLGGRASLRTLADNTQEILNDPVKFLPNCPIIRSLYGGSGNGGTGSGSGPGSAGGPGSSSGASGSMKEGQRTEEKQSGAKSVSGSSDWDITNVYPPDTPDIVFDILNVTGPITNVSPVGTEARLSFSIRSNSQKTDIINVPVKVKIISNKPDQIIMEVMETWWIPQLEIGSKMGMKYTLNKS